MFDNSDRVIFEKLSENSRTPLKEIASEAECSIQTVVNRMRILEKDMGLRYTIEPDFARIGYSTEFFIKVKFREGVIPNTKVLKDMFDTCPYVQFAALTKGDFDLFIWAIAPSKERYEIEMEAKLRVDLDKYFYDWTAHGLLVKRGGFLPIGDEAINILDIDQTKKVLLRILNKNSRMSLTEIAKKMNISKPTAKYHVNKLKNYVKRFTAFFGETGKLVHSVRFFQVVGSEEEFKKYGPEVYDLYLKKTPDFFNKTVYAVVPDGGVDNFFLETYSSMEDFNKQNEVLEKYFDIIIRKHSCAIIVKVLKGLIPVRKIDLSKEIPFLLSAKERKKD